MKILHRNDGTRRRNNRTNRRNDGTTRRSKFYYPQVKRNIPRLNFTLQRLIRTIRKVSFTIRRLTGTIGRVNFTIHRVNGTIPRLNFTIKPYILIQFFRSKTFLTPALSECSLFMMFLTERVTKLETLAYLNCCDLVRFRHRNGLAANSCSLVLISVSCIYLIFIFQLTPKGRGGGLFRKCFEELDEPLMHTDSH